MTKRKKKMTIRHSVVSHLAKLLVAMLPIVGLGTQASAEGNAYPNRPIRIITHAAAGGAPDVLLRVVAARMSDLLGQQIVVLNQPGAGGAVAARGAAAASPDGYTLYMPAASAFVALAGLQSNLPLQLPRDFMPIGFIGEQPMFLTVDPKLGVSTLAEYVALAKKQPGKLSYASTGRGTMTHLTGELLNARAGIDVLAVPYTGGANQALGDVMGGRLTMAIEGLAALAGAIEGGAVKPIAVGSPERLPNFPNLPAAAETLPGFNARGWLVLVAPNGTPAPVINVISEALRKAMSDRDMQNAVAVTGNYLRPLLPQEVMAYVQAEQEMWKPFLEKIAGK
jgi:tripartite-type tricarboxylate transporter receptor subunit TctC